MEQKRWQPLIYLSLKGRTLLLLHCQYQLGHWNQ